LWIEHLGWVYDFGSMSNDCKESKDETKAVEKRWWTAEDIFVCQIESIANEASIVNDIAVNEISNMTIC
jgi:hypothetical protein